MTTYSAEDFEGCNGRRVRFAGEGVIRDGAPEKDAAAIVECAVSGRPIALPHVLVTEILPEEIAVGDRVSFSGLLGHVLHVEGNMAWMKGDSGTNYLPILSHLTLVERKAR